MLDIDLAIFGSGIFEIVLAAAALAISASLFACV